MWSRHVWPVRVLNREAKAVPLGIIDGGCVSAKPIDAYPNEFRFSVKTEQLVVIRDPSILLLGASQK